MSNIEQSPESQTPPFDSIKDKILSYIENPNAVPSIYREVQGYFHAKCDYRTWSDETTLEAEELLSTMRSKMVLPQDENEYLHHGNNNNMTVEMPHFYYINQNVLSWFIYGSLKHSKELPPEKKIVLAAALIYKSLLYDPLQYDYHTNKRTIEDDLMPQEKTKAGTLSRLKSFVSLRPHT